MGQPLLAILELFRPLLDTLFHLGVGLLKQILRHLALGYVCPGSDQLQRVSGLVVRDSEAVLDPDVMPVLVAETVVDGTTPALDQRRYLVEDLASVLRMEIGGPVLRIPRHFVG
ncbi:hypothetical protein [Hyphomicrobium sp. CS1GBMeth3]|uniref:hypothetical protein n=1 Tax=Hyphomicrobium sp. CS1GBMeth3 TaxID=1892845 RepID=UPI001FCD27C6|nr:hypothetical protein [Hyphomicrobium sp. CS1GBMeth3]